MGNGVCNMPQQRKHHSKEFKEQTVKYIQQNKKSIPDIAEELNIPVNTLSNWMRQYRKFEDEPFVGSGNLRESERIMKEKNDQIKELEEEVAILKKAMHFFSKDRK